MMLPLVLLPSLLAAGQASAAEPFLRTTAIGPAGDVEAVYGILERILPGERAAFTFELAAEGSPATVQETKLAGADAAGFTLQATGGKVKITAAAAPDQTEPVAATTGDVVAFRTDENAVTVVNAAYRRSLAAAAAADV